MVNVQVPVAAGVPDRTLPLSERPRVVRHDWPVVAGWEMVPATPAMTA